MGIKIAHPKNSIIIEGLWGTGKSRIAQEYSRQYGYSLVKEPLHTLDHGSRSILDLDTWYLAAHQEHEQYLLQHSIVMERSILSTFAFQYALKRPLPSKSHIIRFRDLIRKNRTLLVYLKFEEGFTFEEKELNKYSKDIQTIFAHRTYLNRYQEWYEKILPQEYDIVPLKLKTVNNGTRRKPAEMVQDIHLSLACQRIGQINATCFKADEKTGLPEVLILKRSSSRGGFFQTITGGIHPGEPLSYAATREIAEEIGIPKELFNVFKTPLVYSFVGSDGYELYEYVFGCEIIGNPKITMTSEHEKFEWTHYQKAKASLSFEDNKKAIDEVLKKWGNSSKELPH